MYCINTFEARLVLAGIQILEFPFCVAAQQLLVLLVVLCAASVSEFRASGVSSGDCASR